VRNFTKLVAVDREQMFVDRDDVGEQMLVDRSDANLFRSRLGLENPKRSRSAANAKLRNGAIERDTNRSLARMNRSFERMNRSFAQKKMTARIKTLVAAITTTQQPTINLVDNDGAFDSIIKADCGPIGLQLHEGVQ
jgi:hypothetical protein